MCCDDILASVFDEIDLQGRDHVGQCVCCDGILTSVFDGTDLQGKGSRVVSNSTAVTFYLLWQ